MKRRGNINHTCIANQIQRTPSLLGIFSDSILQQKEHFSAYVFEDEAYELLQTNPELKSAFEQKKANDIEFAKDSYAQLDFIYHQSSHYEKTHRVYPVGRVFK